MRRAPAPTISRNTATTGGVLTGFGQGSGSLTIGKLWIGGRDNAAGIGTVNINTTGTIATQSTGGFQSNKSYASVIIGNFGGTGTLNMDSGTVNNASTTELAFATTNAQATRGTFNLGGGIFNSEGDFPDGLRWQRRRNCCGQFERAAPSMSAALSSVG